MILQLNNTVTIENLRYKPKADYISSKEFPEQDMNYLGKKIRVRFKDQSENFIRGRLPINKTKFPEFIGDSVEDSVLFTIVRWDKGYPYRIICIDRFQRVIIPDRDWLELMIYYPGYIPSKNEVIFRQANSWEEFNREYMSDMTYHYPIQNNEILGTLVFSEYYNDIITYDSAVNRMVVDYSKQYKPFEQLKEQLLIGNPSLEKMPDCILKSYPHYYDRHKKDRVDIPRRAINSGIVIRSDKDHTVILEILEDGTKRYVCDDEGFFYYESESEKTNIKELDIWQQE